MSNTTTIKSKTPFKLCSTLAGHNSDVRSLSSSPTGPIIFSSSRDGTARSWFRDTTTMKEDPMDGTTSVGGGGGGGGWKEGVIFEGQHDGFVGAVQWVSDEGNGYLVTAGQDKLINVWPIPSNGIKPDESNLALKPSHTLIGHEGNVCGLNISNDGKRLISSSWDLTAKVWDTSDFSLKHTLKGHEQAVWAVLALDGNDDLVLTGSADNLVKLWSGSKVKTTFKGHTQAVRALAKLDSEVGAGDLFASAGNDGTIRIWSLTTGASIHILYGHDSFVYSLSPIPNAFGGGLISGGEDRTMRIWRADDGTCEQAIVIPAVSGELELPSFANAMSLKSLLVSLVWCVTCLSSGDIVAGSSDGLVRVFTRDESRVADLETLTAYDQQVSKTAVNSSQVGAINKNNLLGPEALLQPGKKEGQVLVIKNEAGGAEAHQWSSSTGWVSVGEVVDAVGSDRKQLYQGQEYDYVFDVDFKDGTPNLKLPFNASQNPYEAAQKFLLANELPLEYMDQVVEFIEKSTEGVTLGASNNDYVDPYTGASRYTGGGAGSRPAAPASGFTGDPYTGGGRTSAPAVVNLLPHKTFLNFTQANLPALRTKIGQLNDTLLADSTTTEFALSNEELSILDEIITIAERATAKSFSDSQIAVILRLLSWPSAQVFPSLDLVRVISRFAPISESIPLLLHLAEKTSGPTKEQETNTMLAFRALANVFTSKSGQTLMVDEASEIIDMLSRRGFVGVSKNGKVALATIALNYSVLAGQDKLDSSSASTLFGLVGDLLKDADGEVVYRTLVTLGNLLLAKKYSVNIPGPGIQRYKTLAKDAVKRLPESRNKSIVVEIERV